MATADFEQRRAGTGEAQTREWLQGLDLPFRAAVCFFSHADGSDLSTDSLQEGLSAGESAYLQDLQSRAAEGRVREWLLGRWCGKVAVRRLLGECGLPTPAWQAIGILPDAHGRPTLHGDAAGLTDLTLSLAHTRQGVLALAAKGVDAIGIDLEQRDRAPRNCPGFARHVLSDQEAAQLAGRVDCGEHLLRYWVAKEAAAKAVGTGFQGQPKRFVLTAAPVLGRNTVQCATALLAVHIKQQGDALFAVAHRAV